MTSAQVAHAGQYAPQGNPTKPRISASCDDKITSGLDHTPPYGGPYTQNRRDPDDDGVYEISNTFEFVWVPDGPLKDDPAPLWNAVHTFGLESGPVKAIASGRARAIATASFTPGGIELRADSVTGSPATAVQPAGNLTETLSGSLNNNVLRFTVTLTAKSTSSIAAGTGASGETQFNGITIATTANPVGVVSGSAGVPPASKTMPHRGAPGCKAGGTPALPETTPTGFAVKALCHSLNPTEGANT